MINQVTCIGLIYTKFMPKGYSLWMLKFLITGRIPRPRSTIKGVTMSLNLTSCCVEIPSMNSQIVRRIFQFVLVSTHFSISLSAHTWECISVISTSHYQSSSQSSANSNRYLKEKLPSRWSERNEKKQQKLARTFFALLNIGNSRSEFQLAYLWHFRSNPDFITKIIWLGYVLSEPEGFLYSNNWTF